MALHARIAIAALVAAAIGTAGCGGSAEAPPPAATAPATPAPQATTASNGQGKSGVSTDIGQNRAASERAVREWGAAATRACRVSRKEGRSWEQRMRSMPGRGNPSRAQVAAFGRVVAGYAKAAEGEYDRLRAVALPSDPEAVHTVYTFLEMEEEALRLVQRLGAEFSAVENRDGVLLAIRRLNALNDDYRRAAKAAYAGACAQS